MQTLALLLQNACLQTKAFRAKGIYIVLCYMEYDSDATWVWSCVQEEFNHYSPGYWDIKVGSIQ